MTTLYQKKISDKYVELDPMMLKFIPNHFQTQKMCKKVITKFYYTTQYVPG